MTSQSRRARASFKMTLASLGLFAGIGAFGLVGTAAKAQQYPTQAINVIVPYGTGQATDIMCRVFLDQLRVVLGQTIIPENRPGAGGNIGGAEAARADPDGYTLLCTGNATHLGNPLMYDNMGFDPFEDLAPITRVAGTGFVMLGNEKYAGKSLEEVLEIAAAAPEPLTVGLASTTAQVVFGELENAIPDANFIRIPYSAGNQAMFADLISGEIDLAIEAMPSAMGQVAGGRVAAIAVTTPVQSDFFPGVPTFIESGYDIELVGWNAFYAPADTPQEYIDILNRAANEALRDPEVAVKLGAVASVPLGGSIDDHLNAIQVDLVKWERTIRALDLRAS